MAEIQVGIQVDDKQLTQLNNNIKQIDKSANKFGNSFSNSLNTINPQLGGMISNIQEGTQGLSNMGGVGSIAGGAIGAGIAVAVLAMGALIKGIDDAQKTEQKFINIFGEFEKKMKIQSNVITQMNNVAQEDLLKTVNSFSKASGVSINDAFVLIKQGFDRGANANGEFLDSMREYSPLFLQMGLSANETTALLTNMGNSGVFSDKAADSVKEAGLKLQEFSKATEASLQPLGKQSVELIKTKIAGGKVFEAIQLVSRGITDAALTVQEKSAIMADVFGSAGEDASLKWIEGIQNVNLELDSYKTNLTEATKVQENLTTAWEVLKTQIFDANGELGKLMTNVKLSFTETLKSFSIFLEAGIITRLKMYYNTLIDTTVRAIMFPINALIDLIPGISDEVKKKMQITGKMFQFDLTKDENYKKAQQVVNDLNNVELLNNKGTKETPNKTVFDKNLISNTAKTTQNPLKDESLKGSGTKTITINIDKIIETVKIEQTQDPLVIKQMITKAIMDSITDATISF